MMKFLGSELRENLYLAEIRSEIATLCMFLQFGYICLAGTPSPLAGGINGHRNALTSNEITIGNSQTTAGDARLKPCPWIFANPVAISR